MVVLIGPFVAIGGLTGGKLFFCFASATAFRIASLFTSRGSTVGSAPGGGRGEDVFGELMVEDENGGKEGKNFFSFSSPGFEKLSQRVEVHPYKLNVFCDERIFCANFFHLFPRISQGRRKVATLSSSATGREVG